MNMTVKYRDGADWFLEGQLLLRKGEHEESVGAFTHAIREGWDPVISHLSRGVANLMAEHPAKAHDDFTEVLKLDGLNTRALFYRGSASMAIGSYLRARGDFTRALEIDPGYGLALLNRGVCHAHTGEYEEAAADIKQAMMVAETDAQHFADTMGIWRNHLEGVLGVLHEHTDLSDEDMVKLKAFFE
jgi:tetratricopeptide (TPR) repeat protein